MPRQIDLRPHNFHVSHDPNKRIGWNGTELKKPPTAAEALRELEDQLLRAVNLIIARIVHILTFGAIPIDAIDNALNNLTTWAENLFNPATFTQFLSDLWSFPARFISGIGTLIMDGVHTVQHFLNGLWSALTGTTATSDKRNTDVHTAAAAVTSTASTAYSTAATTSASVVTISDGVYNAWYGSGGSGSPSQVATTVTSIKSAISAAWTVQQITSSGTWNLASSSLTSTSQILEFWVILVGGGGGGGKGQTGSGYTVPYPGGFGAAGGAYLAQQIDPAALGGNVTVTVGGQTSGSTSAVTAITGSVTAFGASGDPAGVLATTSGLTSSAIGSIMGYYDAAASAPGSGGDGGHGNTVGGGAAENGYPGGSTPLALGGSSGTAASAGDAASGSAGSTASLTGQTRCGGGGGGGGGGARTGNGGAGGNGGFPGGGGAGGGGTAGAGKTGGTGGTGAAGTVLLVYRTST